MLFIVRAGWFSVQKPLRKTKCNFRRDVLPFCTMEALETVPSNPATHRIGYARVSSVGQNLDSQLRVERASAGRTSAKARGKTGGRPRTDVMKLENAKVLYENSGKTADEVCKVVGVGRRIFFSYLAQQREMTHTQ